MKAALVLAAALLPTVGFAQGSSFKTDFRLIDFNETRQVCLSAGAELFEAHDGPVFGTIEQEVTHTANAISLDQDWIEIEIGEAYFLVRPEDLSFGAC